VKKLLPILCYFAIFSAALWGSSSTCDFALVGFGLAVLLDRCTFQLMRRSVPVSRTRELGVRALYFVLASLWFYVMRLGLVPVREAATFGVGVCLITLAFESLAGLLTQLIRRLRGSELDPRPGRLECIRPKLIALVPLVFLSPLVALHPLHTVPKRNPAASGLGFEEVRFRAPDGTQLGGWLVPHPQARGNVIFCHGHGRNRGHVVGLLRTFQAVGLNVLAFDFRGHGESPGHTATFGRREVQDLLAAEAFLRQQFPDKPLFVVGVSYGAAVTLQALPSLPGVAGVWVEGCFSRFENVVTNWFGWVPDPCRGALVSVYTALGWLDCGFWCQDINPIEHLSQVTIPIYFCHGREDELIPLAEGKALYDAYAGPKWHWWVQGATHHDVRQRNRDEYLRRLQTFLEDRLAECGPRAAAGAGPWRCGGLARRQEKHRTPLPPPAPRPFGPLGGSPISVLPPSRRA
jgi:alpha-beta hydrolase superfamily lysophospholipase